MILELIQLIVLFFVIFNPLLSFSVYVSATSSMKHEEKRKIANIAIGLAWGLSLVFLIFGEGTLLFLNTNLQTFQIAGGIILFLLGLNMVTGKNEKKDSNSMSAKAISSVIATPLLTGPAAITTIIISTTTYGRILTGIAFSIVLLVTYLMFKYSKFIERHLNETSVQIMTTILGMITMSWGIGFIRAGFGI